MIWKNKQEYAGDFVKGLMHGQGAFKLTNDTILKGTWENDKFLDSLGSFDSKV